MAIKWNEVTLKKHIEENSECKYISHTNDDKNIWITLKCSCGNEFRATRASFDKGQKQCRDCGHKIHHEKLTLWNDKNLREYVDKESNETCEYISYERDEESNHLITLNLRCHCGNLFSVLKSSFDKMKKKQCKKCAYDMLSEEITVWNEGNIKLYVESNSECKFLSYNKEKNKKGIIKLRCKCGNIFKTNRVTFDNGKKQCNECGKKNRLNKTTIWNDKNLKELVEEKTNCEYLGFIRNNQSRIFLKLRCVCGNIFEVEKGTFDKGKINCNICNGVSEDFGEISLAEKYPESLKLWDYDKNIDTPFDVSYASNQKRWFKCHNGLHDSEYRTINGFSSGSRCNVCSSQLNESRLATTLKQVLKHEFVNTIWEHDLGFRGLNGGLSKYDIFVPELNLIIEIQSQYHDSKKQKKLDKFKKEYAINLGYDYIELDTRDFTPLQGIQMFFPKIKTIPKYVSDLKNTTLNWDINLAQKLLNEDNEMTIQEIADKLGVTKGSIASAIKDKRLDGSKHKIHNKGVWKPVVQMTLDGKYIKTFENTTKAKEETGATNIANCCKGEFKFSGNFIWMYEKDYLEILKCNEKIEPQVPRSRKIVQLDLNGNFINEFNTIKEASEKHMVTHSAIINCLKGKAKTSKGYKWMYKDDYEKIYNITSQAS